MEQLLVECKKYRMFEKSVRPEEMRHKWHCIVHYMVHTFIHFTVHFRVHCRVTSTLYYKLYCALSSTLYSRLRCTQIYIILANLKFAMFLHSYIKRLQRGSFLEKWVEQLYSKLTVFSCRIQLAGLVHLGILH